MSWIPIPKPTNNPWTDSNLAQGKESYDDPLIQYDQANVYYDGVNPNQWSKSSKPASTPWTKITKPV